jgi:hypothetical protein
MKLINKVEIYCYSDKEEPKGKFIVKVVAPTATQFPLIKAQREHLESQTDSSECNVNR